MLEILQFIFSRFWVWLGTVALLWIVLSIVPPAVWALILVICPEKR